MTFTALNVIFLKNKPFMSYYSKSKEFFLKSVFPNQGNFLCIESYVFKAKEIRILLEMYRNEVVDNKSMYSKQTENAISVKFVTSKVGLIIGLE